MPSLKTVEFGFNKFCGPSVLSILTGKSTDECANVISRINGQYSVSGVLLSDLLKAAERMGFSTHNANTGGMSLYRTLVTLAPKGDGTYIVSVPNHFVCVEVADRKVYFCDNHTKEPIPAASSARLGMIVQAAYQVKKNLDYVEPPPPKPKPVFDTIIKFQCRECKAEAGEIRYIIHEPECKWRGYEPDGTSD